MDEIRDELLKYIDAAPTPFHAVRESIALLNAAGFTELKENESWDVRPGGAYYIQRNHSALTALRMPEKPTAGELEFRLIGAHTDSPNLRLKPKPEYRKHGYVQLGVEVYGGVLLNSWLDRDLSMAGRVMYKQGDEITAALVDFEKPVCRVPQLAIHLDRKVNDGLKLNQQKHMPPILGLSTGEGDVLPARLGELLKIDPEHIVNFELQLYSVEKSAVSGLNGEFIHAPRLDNLAMCHAGLRALAQAAVPGSAFIPVVALFDNEEVGSATAQGADSPFLASVLERTILALDGRREDYLRALTESLFVSADMAHAIHPNYPDRHEDNHHPRMNEGPVIKINSNQRYATDGPSAARFEMLCEQANVPVQKFVNRTDLACGSTIGPITAAALGIRTVDVGNAMLSMHSAREMAGSADQAHMVKVFAEFFK